MNIYMFLQICMMKQHSWLAIMLAYFQLFLKNTLFPFQNLHKMLILVISLCIASGVGLSQAQNNDIITSLPGLDQLPDFNMFVVLTTITISTSADDVPYLINVVMYNACTMNTTSTT